MRAVPIAAAFLGVLAVLALAEAGEAPSVWLPLALLMLGLTVVLAAARPELVRSLPRPAAVAAAALLAFAAWSYASIAWAEAKGSAWDGANRALFYALTYVVLALWPWTARAAAAVLGVFAAGVAALGLGSLAHAARLDDPASAFIDRLLVEPLGYHNATAALFVLAFWPAVFLGSRRELPPPVRGLLVGAAAALLCLALPAQSRGALFVFPFALVAFLVLVPGRGRLVLALAAAAGAALAASGTLLDVYERVGAGEAGPALASARNAVALAWLGAGLAGVALALVDARVELAPQPARTLSAAAVAVAVLAGAVATAVALPADPADRVRDRWEEFKGGEAPDEASSHFSSSLGSNRYDFWRVGLREFREAPVAGIGADNFAVPYVRDRRSDEEPLYPHSLEVQVLSQTGLVGGALFATFLAGAGLVLLRLRRATSFRRGIAATCVATAVYWLGHASGDWLWEFPVVTCAAVGLLGLAAGLARGGEPPRAALPRRVAWPVGVAAAAAALSLALPWLAAKEVDAAAASWPSDPEAAYARLERARTLNPLSERADLVEGAIASRRGDWPRMRAAFTRALGRNPGSWYAAFELAVVDGVEGRRDAALARLGEARRLNPGEPALDVLERALRTGARVDPDRFDRLFLERLEERVT